jgi:hypothetical protein
MTRLTTKEYKVIAGLLEDGEEIGMELVERFFGGAELMRKAHLYATNKRILIVKRSLLGFHNSIKIIKYHEIKDVQLERGTRYCKVHFALTGESTYGNDEQKKWICGLTYEESAALLKYMDKTQEKPVQSVQSNDRYSYD